MRANDDSQEEPSGQKENSTRMATKTAGPERATRPKFMNRDFDPGDGGRVSTVTGAKIAYSVAGAFAAARHLTSHSRRPIVACIRRDKQAPHSASSPSPLTGEVSQEDREDVISADVDRDTAVDDAHAITDTLNKLDLDEIEMTITDIMTPILVTRITPDSLEVDRVLDIGAASNSAYDGLERCGTSIEIATAPNHNRSPISEKQSGVARGAMGDRWEGRKGSDRDRRSGSDSEQLASQKAKALSLRQSGAGLLLDVTERVKEEEDHGASHHALSDSQPLSLTKLKQRVSLQGSGSMTRPSDCSVSASGSPRIAKAAVLEGAIPFRSRHGMAITSSSPFSSETDSVDLSNVAAALDGSPTCLDRPNPATQPAVLNKADLGTIGLTDTDVKEMSSVGQVDSRMKNRNVPVKPTPIRIGTTQAQSAYHGHRRLTQGNAFACPITISSTQQAQDLQHTLLKTKTDDMLLYADRDSHSSTHGSSKSRSEGNLAAQIQLVNDEVELRSDSSPVRRLSPAKVPSAGHREGSAIQHAEHHAVQDDIHLEFLRGQKREEQPVTDRSESETAINIDRADRDSTQTRECEGAAAGPAVLIARPPAFPKSPSSPGTPRPPLTTKRTSLDSAYSQSRARRVVVPNGSTAL